MLRYHLGRLNASLRILFPEVEPKISEQDALEVKSSPCAVRDSHPHLAYRQASSPCILFAGEKDAAGRVAAMEIAGMVAERTGSKRVKELTEETAGMLGSSESDFFVLVVECEHDGELVMGGRKCLRAIKRMGRRSTVSKFCALCLASSTCR